GESFLRILELGVYARPLSPYRRLLKHARIEFEDVARLVRQEGVEETLRILRGSGVYVTLEEFKGRAPIRRPGLEFVTHPWDFDNPLLAGHYVARTGASRGVGSRVLIDLDLLTQEAAYARHLLVGNNALGRPIAVWYPAPPNSSGLKWVFRTMKLGCTPERWFSQSRTVGLTRDARAAGFAHYTFLASRFLGRPSPRVRYVPQEQAAIVARWLAAKKAAGVPGVLVTTPSSGVRVCAAAASERIDIARSLFVVGSEPFTSPKAEAFARVGVQGVANYAMTELGTIAYGCAAPLDPDDVHVFTDKVAVIATGKEVGAGGAIVPALILTTLLPSCPKLMLNTEVGDYAILEERDCGCHLGRLGLTTHLRRVLSYEKLTSEGVTFLGSDLLELVDRVLPARFGGHPADYQLVEEEERGLPLVSVVASPRLGSFDEAALVAAVLDVLASSPAGELMANQWRQGRTLRVARRDPYVTRAPKILPLHVRRDGR
ncbi:MAG TPA: hypothetical protein VMS64_16295, partial [Candidatus Methylomirabilis sp.]|nr:hypothetical protein [Candidatus Methylomirabilis sp.]